jgi:hypothetical protein
VTTLHHGDCLDVMRALPDCSVDSIVTDPPYGLGFMGKEWDALPPGREWAKECLRVLKPGGHLLAFGGTRTFHRLACAIEDAGLEIRDSIAWMHGQGFPKGKAQLKPAHEPIVVARKKTIEPRTGLLQIDAARIESGRWPANVVLDESQAAALDAQSGDLSHNPPAIWRGGTGTSWGGSIGKALPGEIRSGFDDKGGASRFYFCAKASSKERPVVDGIAHPTVKPLALMRWLVRLVTPPGGTLLDTFAGSGTTVEAAILEGLHCIAIERETDYLQLIQARIFRANAAVASIEPNLFTEETA